jgi:hypothetical protein
MSIYMPSSRKFVIKQRKNGSAYLETKITMKRHFYGSILLIALTILLGFLINFQINAYQEELRKIAQREHIHVLDGKPIVVVPVIKQPSKDELMQKALVSYIASHYLISERGASKIVAASIEAGKAKKIEVSLITAIIAIESKFNPYAKSTGKAEGLMQVIPYWHPEKMKAIGGTQNIIETRENIFAGSATIKEYLVKFNNDKVLALQQYNGTLNDSRRKYSNLVLNEKRRIDQWLSQHMKA